MCTDRLLKCKVPTIVRRLPRKIEERAQWKGMLHSPVLPPPQSYCITSTFYNTASEFQNWVLLYAIPVLEGILPEPYYGHFGKLICAISILLSCEIDRSLLTRAEMYLNDFCKGMEELYGKWLTWVMYRVKSCIVLLWFMFLCLLTILPGLSVLKKTLIYFQA